jgi:hypothetical protein
MPGEKTVVSDGNEDSQPEINADSSVDEIMSSFPEHEEADDSGETTTPGTEQDEASGDDDKTQSEDGKSEDSADEVEEGKPIPYNRFKEVNEKYKTSKTRLEEAQKALDDAKKLFEDPEMLSLAMKKQGYSEDAISEELTKRGMDNVQSEKPEYDLKTVEGWQKKVEDMIDKKLSSVRQILTKSEQESQSREVEAILSKEREEVTQIAKDKFGLEFGTLGKDENNTGTALGIIADYVRKNPGSEKHGYSTIFKLAMFGRGEKIAEERGIKKEKERLSKVRNSAMESEASNGTGDTPDASWSVDRIIDWQAKNEK